MKLPNVTSMVALLLVVLPAVSVGIEQVFPAAEWYWSPLVVTLLGVVAKVLQESLASTGSANGASTGSASEVQPDAPPWVSALGAPASTGSASGASTGSASEVQPLWRRVMLG